MMEEERVCSLAALRSAPKHVLEVRLASGRGVAVWLRGGGGGGGEAALFCLDAACYHHGGPLAAGDIEEVHMHTPMGGGDEARTCVLCPWHHYKIDLASGDCLYTAVDAASGAATLRSKGVKQRPHAVRSDGESVFVRESAPPPPPPPMTAAAAAAAAAAGAGAAAAAGSSSGIASGATIASDTYALQPFLPDAGTPFAGGGSAGVRLHSVRPPR